MPASVPVVNPLAGSANSPPPLPAARRGRPIIFDQSRRHEYCNLLRLGCSRSKAARLVGITRRCVLYAARRDPDFAEQIRTARIESRLDPINKIAGSKSWQAAAWLLERNSRDFRLPPKPSAARQADKLFKSKRLHREIRRILEKLLANPHEIARNGKESPAAMTAIKTQPSLPHRLHAPIVDLIDPNYFPQNRIFSRAIRL